MSNILELLKELKKSNKDQRMTIKKLISSFSNYSPTITPRFKAMKALPDSEEMEMSPQLKESNEEERKSVLLCYRAKCRFPAEDEEAYKSHVSRYHGETEPNLAMAPRKFLTSEEIRQQQATWKKERLAKVKGELCELLIQWDDDLDEPKKKKPKN